MGLLNSLMEARSELPPSPWVIAVFALLSYPVLFAVYNVYFHPLAKFPGPKLWAASRIPYIAAMMKGTLVKKELEFHKKYGQMCRIGPDEISISRPDAWDDMHGNKSDHEPPGRHPMWYQTPNGLPANLQTTTDLATHLRMRNLLKSSFSEKTFRTQHNLVHSYVDLFIDRLRALADAPEAKGKGASINIVDWLTFLTTDIIGDLALGESFHCLRDSGYHPWVKTLYKFFEDMNMAVATRFYPAVDFMVQRMLPKSILDAVKAHTDFVNARLDKRLNLETTRPDFITAVMRDNIDFAQMSLGEMQSSFSMIIVAGSETTATTLCGIINHLIRPEYKETLDKLVGEIRSAFKHEKDITIDNAHKLPYLNAVINEGLRICNPIPGGLYRQIPAEGAVIAGTYIPGLTSVAIRPFCVARDESTFHRASEFVPERWLSGEKQKEFKGDKLEASQPFSMGSHGCLGKPLAWAEMRLGLTRLLWAFDIEMDGKTFKWDEQEMLVMVHKKPFNIRIKAR